MAEESKKIDLLIKIITEYLDVVGKFSSAEHSLAKDGKKLNLVQKVSMDFFLRMNINMDAILPLLNLYKMRKDIIQPIALILRSVFSDMLTQCYMEKFSGDKNETTESFKNELLLLDRDFIKSFLEVGKMEINIKDYLSPQADAKFLGREELEASHKKTKEVFSHLFRPNGDYKTTNELRRTSENRFFISKKERDEPNGFMTEKYRWTHIEREEKFKKFILTFFGFKLFSQFQHYSNLTMKLLEQDGGRLYYYLIVGIDCVFISTDLQIQIIGGQDNKYLLQLKKVKDQLEGCL